MDGLVFVGGSAVIAIIVVLALGLMLAKLYQKSTKEVAFVRTGAGGAKVIKDGGALVLPILHGLTQVNMNTIKLDVARREKEALITYDRMRVDVIVEFFVRVAQKEEAIARAAETLGTKTMNPDELKKLVEGKFVDALRSVASSMTMKDLHEKRVDFVNKVQQAVASDLEKNGLELESVSLTSFDQTKKEFFNPDNAFDAEGLTLLTQEIEQRRKIRNDIEQETKLQIAQKNLNAEREQLVVKQEQAALQMETDKQIALQKAQQEAEIARNAAERTREADTARIEAEKLTEQAQINKSREIKANQIETERELQQKQIDKDRALREATIEQEKCVSLAEQDKKITLAKKSEEQAAAEASAELARAEQVKASQAVKTIEAIADAERRQKIEVISAETAAQKESVKIVVNAEAEAKAADMRAEATMKVAKADADAEVLRAGATRARYDAEAEGQTKLNEAANKQDPEVIAMQVKLKLIERLPEIIRESVRPMEHIDSIKIVDINGMGNMNGFTGENGQAGSAKSLPDQVVDAGLRHQAMKPLIGNLLESVGITDADITKAIQNNLQ
jgi:uncharacterized membrane protein YqiK